MDRAIIGISANLDGELSTINNAYIESVALAGGVPVVIPALSDERLLREMLKGFDGLLLTGGADVDAKYFGEENLAALTEIVPARDTFDFLLMKVATQLQLPIFGICRGVQVINIFFGGSIFQDIPSEIKGELFNHQILTEKEKGVHTVTLQQDSLLKRITGKSELHANSRHHQSIRRIAESFTASGHTADGIVEALEGYPARRIFGVQWHPESMAAAGDPDMQKLFAFFVGESRLFKRAKSLHDSILTIDSHCDTPMLFATNEIEFGERNDTSQVDIPKMEDGRIDCCFEAAYIPQTARRREKEENPFQMAEKLLLMMRGQVEENPERASLATTFKEAFDNKKAGKRSIFLALENGHALEGDIRNIKKFAGLGVKYITLCHNGDNALCDSAIYSHETHKGLSYFGEDALREMNRLGMVIDVSHAAESTFYDVIKKSRKPVIASHASVYALCPFPRNLKDDQLKALAENGGVVQVCLVSDFLVTEGKATVADAVDHIDHIRRVAGIDHVGIGSDFDGGGGIAGCGNSAELIHITVELLRRGYTDVEIEKIWGGNIRRVFANQA